MTQITSRLLPIFPYSTSNTAITRPSGLLGRRRYRALWNEAPFNNNQDLFVIKDDYTKVFGKHFVKAGVLVSSNKKNEDTTATVRASTRRSGAPRVCGQQLYQRPAMSCPTSCCGTCRGDSRSSASRSAPQRWHDLEFYVVRFVAGNRAPHARLRRCGIRCSSILRGRRQDHELRARALQPGARQRPVQRHARFAPGRTVSAGGRQRRHRWPEPLADEPGQQQLRAAPWRRLGRGGNGKTALRAGSATSSCANG